MTSLAQKLSEIIGDAFVAQGLSRELGAVRVADRPDLAQFQCNGALAGAKQAGKNPRAVAEAVIEVLKSRSEFTKLEIAGPGFINISIPDDMIAAHAESLRKDSRQGVEKHAAGTIMLDYGGPNIAKPMHVGHLRSSIIGDALRRMYDFAGYKAIGDVHLGDWGTHLGLLINDYISSGAENILHKNKNPDDPAQVDALLKDMDERYPRASQVAKENPEIQEAARVMTVRLQNKEQPSYAMWEIIRDMSVAGMRRNFAALGVHFDLWNGEASVHDLIEPMVDKLKTKGIAQESDGAWIIPVAQESDKKEMPPLILYKRDGAVMYGTTDLATIVERMEDHSGLTKIIYIVDQRQSLHFEQVFRAARLSAIAPDNVELTHAGFGTMNGPDGKPFKTRAGGIMKLEDLIVLGLEKARARLAEAHLAQDMNASEKEGVAHKVAIAALKFADLQNNRIANYIFDIGRMTGFEGKTGPYLLYQAVRIKSLLRKAESQNLGISESQNASDHPRFRLSEILIREADRPLALLLAELPDHFAGALRHNTPHVLCDYAYKLAQEFSRFYASCHILSETDEAVRASRLALCALTQTQLELVLGLLGIEIPERM
ncbi:MAG: arginine--tRNA ligase [Alphaproteobacteria bacterium]